MTYKGILRVRAIGNVRYILIPKSIRHKYNVSAGDHYIVGEDEFRRLFRQKISLQETTDRDLPEITDIATPEA